MDQREGLTIGLVVVVMDLTMKNSEEVFSQLRKLPLDLIFGKLCFVLCGVKQFKSHQLNLDTVLKEVRKYNSPVLYGMCKDEEVAVVASKIVHILQLVSGEKCHMRACIFSGAMVPKLLDNAELEHF